MDEPRHGVTYRYMFTHFYEVNEKTMVKKK